MGWLSVNFRVWIAEVQDPCILGLDFLRFACCARLGKNTLSFPEGPTVEMVHPAQDPRPSRTLALRAADLCNGLDPLPPGPTSPSSLLTSSTRGGFPLTAPPAVNQRPAAEGGDRTAAVKEIWRRNSEGLQPWQQEELWLLLEEFRDIFALTDDEVGLTHLVQHAIDTGDAHPIKTRPHRLPLVHQAAADSAIEEMQRAGIIEPSDSPWASGVVLVKKKGVPR